MVSKDKKFIMWFDEIGIEDVPYVGGKNASLGEMYQNLRKKGVKIPYGFAVTAYAYRYVLEKSGLKSEIKNILKDLDTHNIDSLAEKGSKIRHLIRHAEIPKELEKDIFAAYDKLCKIEKIKNIDVAVRSSATAEDLPDASFAGQQESYLNITGKEDLLESVRKCFASLFTNRAISYREDKHFDHFSIALSVVVQRMVRSDLASSGVMFSIDTETGFKDAVIINSTYGLGENIVQGAVNPDEFIVFKPTLKQNKKPIISKVLGEKAIRMIYDTQGNKPTKNVAVELNDRNKFSITDDQALLLAKWACIIEDHYSLQAGKFKPMDMEWALDGKTNELFIVQARPETVQSQKNLNSYTTYTLSTTKKPVVIGKSVGQQIATGKVKVIKNVKDINQFKKGEILVTEMTDPDWEPIMKIASGIITNKGGRTCFSGDTKILTNKGFMTIAEIHKSDYKKIKVPSLNRKTLKIEWQNITAVMKRKAKTIQINCSQKGKDTENNLVLTPDHKMINFRNAELVDTEIQDMLSNKEAATIAQYIPKINAVSKKPSLGYLLGGVMSDGHICLSRTHGEIIFIQKPTHEKKAFIKAMGDFLKENYSKEFKECSKKISRGTIRGKPVIGSANAYRCYSKDIAEKLKKEQNEIVKTVISANTEFLFNFLAGVIDGDGTSNKGRVSIYISDENLLQAVVISCLRLNIVPQITRNRNISNLQIVERLTDISKYTKRVKCKDTRNVGTRFFNTKQLFEKNSFSNSDINNRVSKNLLIDEHSLKENLKKIKDKKLKANLEKLLASDLRQTRVTKAKEKAVQDVYNITVSKNHNYLVFTSKYTPLVVNNCHASIVSRELGIPCIVGTLDGTAKLETGDEVTMDCSSGDTGFVYKGKIPFTKETVNLKEIQKTKTQLTMNVGNPEQAFDLSFIPNEGVGLAREEFIINSWIQIHPLALINYNKIKDPETKSKIAALTVGYKDKKQFFVDKLAQGIARIAAAFYPKKVILRLSDFKSNEYANLIGGKDYEPEENNPMIGWRGASRYYQGNYVAGFALECLAIKKVREEFGLTNLELMVRFCRTIDEAKKVLGEMKKNGLEKGKNGLKVHCMCEIPSNVILAEEFLEVFDGFSIGSNDLTQLVLGLDRDSELLSNIYDERNPAVKKMLAEVIRIANKKKKYIGICGQAPSDYPEIAEFLVREGIKSMSLNPDTMIKTRIAIAKLEKSLKK